jgi:hypothetical protein
MSALAAIQSRFHAFVVAGAPASGLVAATTKASAETLMAVYSDAYRLRLIEAMAEDFPALRRFVGEDEFDPLARAYIAAYPSRHFSIRWFGQRLPQFLSATPAYAARPVLAEIAAYEWALGLAIDAADATPVGVAVLAQVPPERWGELRLTFHPSLSRLDLRWPVPSYRQAVEKNESPLPALEPAGEPVAWIVWRQDIQVMFSSLAVAEARLIDQARAGAPFGSLCAALAEEHDPDQAALTAASFLKRWVSESLIVAVAT